jgi:hypothetical protein
LEAYVEVADEEDFEAGRFFDDDFFALTFFFLSYGSTSSWRMSPSSV